MKQQHFLIISLPAQGHINPCLQLAKNLASCGAKVTYATTTRGLKKIKSLPTKERLTYASFSDGHDDDDSLTSADFANYMEEVRRIGSKSLVDLCKKLSGEGQPITFLVYTILVPWGCAVASELQVPSAFLAIQCATVFAIYYRLLNSHDGLQGHIDPLVPVEIPGLPPFSSTDIPTVLLPGDPYSGLMIPMMQEHINVLEQEPPSCVLANTFEELEQDAIKNVDAINIIAIGPLVPSAFIDGKDLTDKSFGADMFENCKDYLEWLDSQPEHSVIFISFGSLVVLSKEQKDEILDGLLQSGRPFLWVIRSSSDDEEQGMNKMLQERGIIVPWCSQVEVLNHKSIGCFVTHCGWNSTLESLVSGVPMIGFPQFSDQTTNAKLVEEVWKTGVRARANGQVMVERGELKKCLDIVMGDGDRGREIRKNASQWRKLAAESVKEGGSTYNNLKKFLENSEGRSR